MLNVLPNVDNMLDDFSEDMMFYGPLEKCPTCGGQLECKGWKYKCTGKYSEWASCIFSSSNPPRRSDPIKVPEDISNDFVNKVMRPHSFKYYSFTSAAFNSRAVYNLKQFVCSPAVAEAARGEGVP